MILAKNIHKYYGDLEVLKGVDLTIKKGEVVAIVGPSGAGKTTLLQILGTLDRPDSGTVIIDGVDPFKLNSKALAKFRNEKIGFVFQFHYLINEFNVLENVAMDVTILQIRPVHLFALFGGSVCLEPTN